MSTSAVFILCIAVTAVFAMDTRPCSTCEETPCSNLPAETPICSCDSKCRFFRDCCLTPPICTSPTPTLNPGVNLECRPVYKIPNFDAIAVGDAYQMVSTCPVLEAMAITPSQEDEEAEEEYEEEYEDEYEEEDEEEDDYMEDEGTDRIAGCIGEDTDLPPVTDPTTGLVYRNEHCAICNGVTRFLAWQANIVCKQSVYDLLGDNTVAEILEEDRDIFSTDCQECNYRPPDLELVPLTTTIMPRPCLPSTSTCLEKSDVERIMEMRLDDTTYLEMVEGCQSDVLDLVKGPVNGVQVRFRNRMCAWCNGVNDESLICDLGETSRNSIPFECSPVSNVSRRNLVNPFRIPYTITLSNLQDGEVVITANGDAAPIQVECPAGQAPIGLTCRETECPGGYTEIGGQCFLGQPTTPPGDTGRTSPPSGNDSTDDVTHLDCPSALLPLNSSEYEDRGNGTIFHDGDLIEVQFYDSNGRPLICPDNTSLVRTFGFLVAILPGISELTYVGCSLSILGSVLVLVTYGLFNELRTFPTLLMINLCVALLVVNLLFVIGGPIVQYSQSIPLCTAVGILLHFSHLAQFTWMVLFSLEVTHSFYLAQRLQTSGKKGRKKLLINMLIGWGVPLVICAITVVLNFSGSGLVNYGVTADGSAGSCWINHFLSFVISFLIPLVLSLLANLVLFSVMTAFLCQSFNSKVQKQKSNYVLLIRVWLATLSTTGLTWLFGFLAIPNGGSWAWYPFVIFNSTQGFSIFLAFLCTKKIFNLYCSLVCKEKKEEGLGDLNEKKLKSKLSKLSAKKSSKKTSSTLRKRKLAKSSSDTDLRTLPLPEMITIAPGKRYSLNLPLSSGPLIRQISEENSDLKNLANDNEEETMEVGKEEKEIADEGTGEPPLP